jgi:hypothetical protein
VQEYEMDMEEREVKNVFTPLTIESFLKKLRLDGYLNLD